MTDRLYPKGVCVKTLYGEVTDPGRDPLTRPAAAGENAVAGHPLPQGGEGWAFTLSFCSFA